MAEPLRAVPARPYGIQPIIVRDKTKNYVVVNSYSSTQQKILQSTVDDVETEVSLRAYDQMEVRDSAVGKSTRILITSVLADDLQFAPGATEDDVGTQEHDTYVQVMELCERAVKGLSRPMRETLEQILRNGIKYGNGVAEIEWDYRTDIPSTKPKESQPKGRVASIMSGFKNWWKGDVTSDTATTTRPSLRGEKTRLMPTAIKVKPRTATRFAVDEYMNILGLVPANRARAGLNFNEIVDREKFMILTINKQNEDPRGRSMYRAAFNWYNVRMQLPTEMIRYVIEETVPKAVGIMAENMPPFEFERDDAGNIIYEDPDTKKIPKMLTGAESFKRQMEGFRSGSGAVIPYGSSLKPYKTGLTGSNDAELFNKLLNITDKQIEGSILHQTLAQSEGEHQSKSASQQVAEVLYNLVFWTRWQLAMMILYDLCEVVVKTNLGDWALKYMPMISLGDFIRRDWVEELLALAEAYFKGFVDDAQRAELMAWLNMPKPGPSRQELGLEAAAKQDVNGQPIQPNSNRPDKSGAGAGRNKGNGTEKKQNAKNTGRGPINPMGDHTGWFRRS